jgi:hypothetical protein
MKKWIKIYYIYGLKRKKGRKYNPSNRENG